MNSASQFPHLRVTSFFAEQVSRFKSELEEIEASFQPENEESFRDCLAKFIVVFHQSREDCLAMEADLAANPRLLTETQQRFRQEVAEWFDQSWFFDRAKRKPRGYPGDYEMLTALYDQNVKSTGIGLLMDHYFLQADLARAVRTRLAAVKGFVLNEIHERDQDLSILNVASGLGREYVGGFETFNHNIKLTCLDTDEEAIQCLKESMDPQLLDSIELDCRCYNALKTVSAEKNIAEFGRSDIIYSVGLCDYIPDGFLIKMLRGWRESLADNGVVYVAFKDRKEYVSSEYQWHADWHFFLRTEEDCRRLFEAAGYDMKELQMSRDETGIIMNFVSRNIAQSSSDPRSSGENSQTLAADPIND